MPTSSMALRVNAICADAGLSTTEKIARLRRLRNLARALQQAAHQCAVVEDDGWYEEVDIIERTLGGLRRTRAATRRPSTAEAPPAPPAPPPDLPALRRATRGRP